MTASIRPRFTMRRLAVALWLSITALFLASLVLAWAAERARSAFSLELGARLILPALGVSLFALAKSAKAGSFTRATCYGLGGLVLLAFLVGLLDYVG